MVREGKSRVDPTAQRAGAVQNGHVAGAAGVEGSNATGEKGAGGSTSAGTASATTPSKTNSHRHNSKEPQLSFSKSPVPSPTTRRQRAVKAASTTTSAPILVNPSPFPAMATTSHPRSRNHHPLRPASKVSSRRSKHALPPISAFSFADILASIDMDVKTEIDGIAEICGRSKLSLANEYGSHLPPHGERLLGDTLDVRRDELGGGEQRALEVVEESAESLGHGSLEASASGEEGEGRGPRGWRGGTGRVGVGRAVATVSDGTATGVVGGLEGGERKGRSLAVRHLQAFTRVGG
ncbi:hypothetical protein MMC11_006235 [Xylographa trunciseda]|nr:hypothetical protein [Xylographa trunciseda]